MTQRPNNSRNPRGRPSDHSSNPTRGGPPRSPRSSGSGPRSDSRFENQSGRQFGPRSGPSTPRLGNAGQDDVRGGATLPPVSSIFTRDTARSVVMNMLARQAAVYPHLLLDGLETRDLNDRDAAFAHAIYDACIKRWLTLACLIAQYTPRPLHENEPPVQAALLAGAAQMVFLEKVPAHAAINASVEWAKAAKSVSVGGFINAVLRKVASLVFDPASLVPPNLPERTLRPEWVNRADELPLDSGGALQLRAAVLPRDPFERLAAATGHPFELVRHWTTALGRDEAAALCHHNITSAPIYICTGYATAPLPTEGFLPHSAGLSHAYVGDVAALSALLRERSDIWVQDAGSSHPVALLTATLTARGGFSALSIDGQPPLIIDLCAGQGTKTRQLAAATSKAGLTARIIAADPAPNRAATLATIVKAIGAQSWSVSDVHGKLGGTAAVVLLDVPCTNTGVLARRAEARYRCDEEHLQRLIDTQRDIITRGVRLMMSGGYLCYSTCSVEPSENEGQARWIEQTFGLTLLGMNRWMPTGLPGEPPNTYSDASFCAVFTNRP